MENTTEQAVVEEVSHVPDRALEILASIHSQLESHATQIQASEEKLQKAAEQIRIQKIRTEAQREVVNSFIQQYQQK